MAEKQVRPYGSWKSPITSDLIVSETIGLGEIVLDGEDIYWIESRPSEKGRSVIVRRTPDGTITDMTPQPFNARTRANEYGGGAFVVDGGTVYFSNFSDQRIYRQSPGSAPEPLTRLEKMSYADGVIDRRRNRLICVREDHTTGSRDTTNTIISIALDGGDEQVLISGNDFYASPRLSPDGARLAWLAWDHPNMPWDGTELWAAELNEDGSLGARQKVAGGASESIFQPEWSPDGVLHFVSDRTGWWNLYSLRDGDVRALREMEAEFGMPQWVFGMSTYAFASAGQIICAYNVRGQWRLASLDTTGGELNPIELPYTEIAYVRTMPSRVVFNAGAPTIPRSIVTLDLATRQTEVLRQATRMNIDAGYLSVPQAIEFPTENNLTAHAFFYAPQNKDFEAPEGERPPLIVISHGGPTSA
ncbi:MAG TPA: S9 family peptidase, partial [Blastocatellia bacterium]|nr:S9 family peptidase [Blastocatellia bacterium]